MVADRLFDRRRQYLDRAVRGHGRQQCGQRGAGRRRLPVARGGDHRVGVNLLPAPLPPGRHLHDARVSRISLQSDRPGDHGVLHDGDLRGRDDHGRLVLRRSDTPHDLQNGPEPGRLVDRPDRRPLHHLGRLESRRVGRPVPGGGPLARRAPGHGTRAAGRRRLDRLCRGEPRSAAHDPARRPSRTALDGPGRRPLDSQLLLLRPEPVHRPAARWPPKACAKGRWGSSSPPPCG